MTGDVESEVERKVGSLLDRIPGYRGYRSKEDRRDADRRVRDHLVTVYTAQGDRIGRVAADLANQRRLSEIGPVDAFARDLRHFVDRVRTATYGYGGLYGDRDVDASALDQLRQFDESLLDGVDELNGPIAELERAHGAGGDMAAPSRAGVEVVRSLLARFDLRGEVVETGKPAPTDSVLKVLAPIRPVEPPAAYNLKEGDALAILGDDFLVDGRITVDGGPAPFRLLRLSGGQGDWLLVPSVAGREMARLKQVAEPGAPTETVLDGATYMPQVSGAGDGEVSGVGGRTGWRSVRYDLLAGADDSAARAVILDWGTERQALAGRLVHPDDVEVFGRPSPRLH